MSSTTIAVQGIGWVLPAGVGSGDEILRHPELYAAATAGAAFSEEFSAKEYLTSVKGYLDPASSYVLAAAVLALGSSRNAAGADIREMSGICTASRFGAPSSGYKFYEQFVRKGARFASPLVFPHGYSNTAGNLAAIEFGFAGPHMVLYGHNPVSEVLSFAATRLLSGEADDMVAIAYEAVLPEAVADGVLPLNGAVALHCTRDGDGPEPLLRFTAESLAAADAARSDDGTVADLCRILARLARS